MLLTPHVIRTSEITVADLQPIFIGRSRIGLGGPPPLIAAPEAQAAPQTTPAPAPSFTQPNTFPAASSSRRRRAARRSRARFSCRRIRQPLAAPAAPPAPPSAARVEQPQRRLLRLRSRPPRRPQAPGAASARTGQPIETTVGSAEVTPRRQARYSASAAGRTRCDFGR